MVLGYLVITLPLVQDGRVLSKYSNGNKKKEENITKKEEDEENKTKTQKLEVTSQEEIRKMDFSKICKKSDSDDDDDEPPDLEPVK